MRHAFFLLSLFVISSCSNNSGEQKNDTLHTIDSGNLVSDVPRLSLYYPLDSTDTNGNRRYHTSPDVELTAQNGKVFSTASFRGKIVINDFFFAKCQGPCPRMTNQLVRVQQAFKGDTSVKIVSYTVDPDRDNAEALQEYAIRFKADTAQWKFVTGQKKKLYDLARYGYYMAVDPGNGGPDDFIHSDQMVLVDRDAHIRGYYSGTDSASVNTLIEDIKTLLERK